MSQTASIEARLTRLERDLEDLRDREAIRDVIHRYCRAADRCDLEAFKSCYWSDGFDDHGFFGGNAHAFCDYVIPVLKKIDSSVHAITNTIIEIDGARAFCESQWSVVHRLRDGAELLDYWHQGRYLDIFEKRDGVWKILVRVCPADMDRLVKTKDLRALLAAGVGPDADFGARGARAPADPVYAGFDLRKIGKERPAMPDLWGPFYMLAKVL
jgi:ketosteroid isomerase-like protein